MSNLTPLQWIGITMVVLSAIAGGSATLTDIGLAAPTVKALVGVANFIMTILGGIITFLSGQAHMVKAVAAMPGVEAITVNTQANQVLASVAMDPKQDKVAPVEGQETAVKDTAES